MIRPRPALWFELLVARDDVTLALEALAGTGAVELETRDGSTLPADFAALRPLLHQFADLSQRYRAFWPTDALHPSSCPEPPPAELERCIGNIRGWAAQAEPLIRQIQQAQAEQLELLRWRVVLTELADSPIDLARASAAGPLLRARLFFFPSDASVDFAQLALVRVVEADGGRYALAVGTPEQIEAMAQQAVAMKGQTHALPPWLGSEPGTNLAEIERRMAALQVRSDAAHAALAALTDALQLRQALGNARRLEWILDNVRALDSGGLFCWITGWTSLTDHASLERAVERSGARALLRFAPSPHALAPLLLANPWWARPFEVFSRALGMPSSTEADASMLLALAVPLMFGYMFGDVGQGLVIAGAGFLVRRRWPIARLFIAGGLAAAVFGLLFGSVFGLHLLHAWWIAPMDDPLQVLLAPLVGGAALLTIGLLLTAVQAHWRGELLRWFGTDAGLLACYLGLVVALVWSPGLGLAAGGALWYCLGHALLERHSLAAATALATLVERLLQILINTLSFARVGAFALAHAGLSSAIVALMDASGNVVAAALVLVAGNVVVMLLEGLVVSIQTTRLVLFEFFTRFLQGQGRVFRPLPPPPSTLQES